MLSRASHRNRKHTAIRVFYTGTRTIPFGLAVHYLTAITNMDVYRIDPVNLLPYYSIYGTIQVDHVYVRSLYKLSNSRIHGLSNLFRRCSFLVLGHPS